MKFILSIIGGKDIAITREQKNKIMTAIDAGAPRIEVNGHVVFVHSIASIIAADQFIASQNMKLNSHGKFMCKHGKVHESEERCECKAEDRLCDGPLVITAPSTVLCPKCDSSCLASAEYCDNCDATLPSSQVEKVEPRISIGVPEALATVAKRILSGK